MREALVNLLISFDSVLFNATGLLFVVFGVFILIRMGGFPDLTVDGSFTIGAALYSVGLTSSHGTPISLLSAAAGGAIGGLLTWTINTRLGVGKVVSGVLAMIILVLSAPYVSGGSTRSLLRTQSFHSEIDALDALLTKRILGDVPYQAHFLFSLFWLLCFSTAATILLRLLATRVGLRLRYMSSAKSPTLLPPVERKRLLLFALMIGNSLIAVGGAVEAQRRGGFTNNMGTGMLLVALAVLVLGEAIVKSFKKRDFLHLREYAAAALLGVFFYATGIQVLLAMRIAIVDLRLLTALFLLLLLAAAGRTYSSTTKLF